MTVDPVQLISVEYREGTHPMEVQQMAQVIKRPRCRDSGGSRQADFVDEPQCRHDLFWVRFVLCLLCTGEVERSISFLPWYSREYTFTVLVKRF